MARNIELTADILNNIPEYATSADAATAGLAVGDYYYDTTTFAISKVR